MADPKRLLVVLDPTVEEQPALARAAWLAERIGAALELFVCYYDQYLSGERFFDSSGLEQARRTVVENQRKRLEELARQLAEEGLTVSMDARWDHPLDQGIVRKAAETRPMMVVKDTHYHPTLKRALFSNTDWNLIRACPVPLLLVKPHETSSVPQIIAAVDPGHAHDKPAELDHAIITLATELSSAVQGRLHVFHAFDPAPAIAGAADSMATPISVPVRELTEALEQRHREAVEQLIAGYPVERENLHIHQGVPQELLISLAQHVRADMVVIGSVSRSRLKRAFIGSTAERVLDRLPCDLMIVKPAGFETSEH
jgi:universal stress protein E